MAASIYILIAVGVIVAILLVVGIVLLAVFLSRKNSNGNIPQNTQTFQAPPDEQYQIPPQNVYAPQYDIPKTCVGVGLGFLGLIGLIIGVCLYPQGTIARTTFIKAWLITFLATMAAEVLLGFVIYFTMFSFLMIP